MNIFSIKKWKTVSVLFLFLSGLTSGCVIPEINGISSENSEQESGEVFINLTDAPGDFLRYSVEVKSISLEKANGALIETLPLSTRVDFSQYVNLTEFVTAATIPSGKYVKATMTLDYSDADIIIETEESQGSPVTNITDSEGNPLSNLIMTVSLLNHDSLIIAPRIPAHLSLDFDLKASNQIVYDDAGEATSLIVEPTLIASVDIDRDKDLRLRGALKETSLDAETFTLFVRPFIHPLENSNRFGQLTVHTSGTTSYEIDGTPYLGNDGLQLISEQEKFTAVIAFGQIDMKNRRLNATQVLAGTSVPWGNKDLLIGHVIARYDNTLTLKGARLERKDGSVHIGKTQQVLISEATRVIKVGFDEALTIDAISVGQQVHIIGDTSPSSSDSFSAEEGLVRLVLTNVRGEIIDIDSASNSALTLETQKFDHLKASIFDFSGTGIDFSNDADPDSYSVNTSTLDLGNFELNDPVIVRGHVNEFGSAPMDFTAQSLIAIKSLKGSLAVSWEHTNEAAIVIENNNSLNLALYSENRLHHVFRRGTQKDISLGGDKVSLKATEANHWVIQTPQQRTVHTHYEAFIAQLEELDSDPDRAVLGLKAHGLFDDEKRVFSATQLTIRYN